MPGKATPGVFNKNNPNKGGEAKPNFSAIAKKILSNKQAEQRRIDIANKSRSANPQWGKEVQNPKSYDVPKSAAPTPPRKGGGGRPNPFIAPPGGRLPVRPKPLFRGGLNPKLNRSTQV